MRQYTDIIKNINITDIFSFLRRHLVAAMGICLAVLIIIGTCVYYYPKEYTSTEIITVEGEQELELPGSISSMLSLIGINLHNRKNNDALRIRDYHQIVHSTPFLQQLLKMQVKDRDGRTILLNDYVKGEYGCGSLFTGEVENHEILLDHIKVNYDIHCFSLYIQVTLSDPVIAQEVTKQISDKLITYFNEYHTQKALRELKYYERLEAEALKQYEEKRAEYSAFADHNNDLTSEKANQQLTQLSMAMETSKTLYNAMAFRHTNAKIKVQEVKPNVIILDPATIKAEPCIPNTPWFLVLLLMEVAILVFLEYASWKTLYTPLCTLMFPFLFVLLATILLIPVTDLVDFYYPSLLVWCIGLPLFAIPSIVFGYIMNSHGVNVTFQTDTTWESFPRIMAYFAIGIGLLFVLHIYQTIGSSVELFGTDEFAEELAGTGAWAHLRELTVPLLMMAIFFVKKKDWLLYGVILFLLIPLVVNMVKGWILIPVIAAIMMRLAYGKMHLSVKLVFTTISSGFLLFLFVYMVLPALGSDNEYFRSNRMFGFVVDHFIHYFTSGALGYSYDMEMGLTDRGDFEALFSPFVNIYYKLSGSNDLISPVPSKYYYTGIDLTNVHTFFGTLHLHTTPVQFVMCTLLYSFVGYTLKVLLIRYPNISCSTAYFYYCGLLSMGWFEFYMWHLSCIEVPILAMALLPLLKMKDKKISNFLPIIQKA